MAVTQLGRVRFPIALVGAVLVSMSLFGFLHALISQRGDIGEVHEATKIEFTRLRQDTEVEKKKSEKAERVKAEQAPPAPQLALSKTSLDPTADSVSAIASLVEAQTQQMSSLSGSGGADREAVPLVRIEPDYPMQARQRGVEGWVVVEFTISTAGTVKDPIVVASEPGTIFDRAAIQAVRKWKYNPKIQDGKPIERSGQKVRLDFEMES